MERKWILNYLSCGNAFNWYQYFLTNPFLAFPPSLFFPGLPSFQSFPYPLLSCTYPFIQFLPSSHSLSPFLSHLSYYSYFFIIFPSTSSLFLIILSSPFFLFYPKHICCLFLLLPSLPKAKRQFSFLCSSLGCRVSRLPQQTMLR